MVGTLGFNKSFAVGSSGRSGGLGIFWNEEIKLEIIGYSEYHIDVMVNELTPTKTRITFVYGEAQVPEQYKTWDMLRGIAGTGNDSWMVIGDFNEVLHGYEHDGVGSRSQAQMDGFRDALDTCGLSDIGYTGTDWTFEKKVAGGTFTRVRLDRCVANPEWAFSYPSAKLEHKASASSDHVALHLRLDGLHACSGSPKPFKYEACWERDQSLPPVIREGWEKTNGDSLLAVRAKLQGLSADLSHWERTQFGSVRREIARLKMS
ncbi:uncharacterized protein [Aegilops tauschii subsp. strangulata]|uniref:uncharacterized protein n=1 Tax=Aegilops tauschii subsp. strangulata TaxID=200361 RepID=UPI003CC89AF5